VRRLACLVRGVVLRVACCVPCVVSRLTGSSCWSTDRDGATWRVPILITCPMRSWSASTKWPIATRSGSESSWATVHSAPLIVIISFRGRQAGKKVVTSTCPVCDFFAQQNRQRDHRRRREV
jgi:hypothetical protein